MRLIDLIVIHCSATPNGRSVNVNQIDGWHRSRGFSRADEFRSRQNSSLHSIGYHFVIYINGGIATGRHVDEVGAHAYGYNRRSIAICMIGTDKFTLEEWSSLKANLWAMQKKFPKARVAGHRDLSPDVDGDGIIERWEWLKTCPGFDVKAWLAADMAPLAGHILEPDPPMPAAA